MPSAPLSRPTLQDEEDLFQYFTSACYSGFGDGPRAFYGASSVTC